MSDDLTESEEARLRFLQNSKKRKLLQELEEEAAKDISEAANVISHERFSLKSFREGKMPEVIDVESYADLLKKSYDKQLVGNRHQP